MRYIFLVSLALFAFTSTINSQYSLIVEESKSSLSKGHKLFKIFVELQHKTDRVSAVFGSNIHPALINAPEGIFNSEFNASWSATGINPQFFEFAPELEVDSYATIGLTAPASLSPSGSEDPLMVEDEHQSWSQFFKQNGATTLVINTRTGGSWFILNTASNGVAGNKKKVLIASITTTGNISGILNVQVFPLGVGGDSMNITFEFDGEGSTHGVPFSK